MELYGIALFIIAASKLALETEYLNQANELLEDNTVIIRQEDNYVIKAYYTVTRSDDYGLNLNLRILNLNDTEKIVSVVNNKTNSVLNDVTLKPYEYEEILLDENIEYDNELSISINEN